MKEGWRKRRESKKRGKKEVELKKREEKIED